MASSVTEEDIRPAALFEEYLRLAALDIERHFSNGTRHALNCPACDREGEPSFTKHGFSYRVCAVCKSLWVSPRPSQEDFQAFYSSSESSRYWSEVFYPAVAQARRVGLWQPKVQRVRSLIGRFTTDELGPYAVVDLGGGNGDFAAEWRDAVGHAATVVDPNPHSIATCSSLGIPAIEAFVEGLQRSQLPQQPVAFTCFELFEHVQDPVRWLTKISQLMSVGDLLILSTLSGTGLDLQVLWEKSKSINPPHHINFLNPYSFQLLADRCGLVCEEVTTPGVLDLDILSNNRKDVSDRFWLSVLDLEPSARARWQQIISDNLCSSHMWVVLSRQS